MKRKAGVFLSLALLLALVATPTSPAGVRYVGVEIADGSATSEYVVLKGDTVWTLCTDAAFDGASFTFTASQSQNDATFLPVVDNAGVAVTLTVAPSSCAGTGSQASILTGFKFIKLVSSAAQSGAATTVTVSLR